MRDGMELDRLVGAAPENQIESWLRRHLDVATSRA
jgi:thioredoxin-like negative regulator of GroEL